MRIVIAEDSVLLREGLERLLADNGFEVVGPCGDADDLLLKIRSYEPDVAIVDIRLPPTHTDEGMRAAIESGPSTRTSACSCSPSTSSSAWP